METIVYLNVDENSIWIRDGYLNFVGREGDEEAHKHSLNLSSIRRYKFLNDTLTVIFKEKDERKEEKPQRYIIDEEGPQPFEPERRGTIED